MFLAIDFFFFTFLSICFLDRCSIYPVLKAGASRGPLLCLLPFFSTSPRKSTTATNGWLCGPAHLRAARPARRTCGPDGPWPQAPCQPRMHPSPCTLHAGHLFPAGAPTPVRRAGGIPGPLLTGHSQEGPRHMSHAPHQTPGSSPEGCGAGHRSCPSTFSPEPRPSHSRPRDPGSHRWFPRR